MNEFLAALGASTAVFAVQTIWSLLSAIDASGATMWQKAGHNMVTLAFGATCFFPFFVFTLPLLRGVA